jgi:dTDP-4-amino-4,6-dideoxygalactose transaminase
MIPIAKPFLDTTEADAAREAVLSGWISQGAQVAAFEREFAALVGAPHACAVSNCTTALHLALLAQGVGPSDEVITASHSFIASANSIRYCGATPVFVDIDPATYNLDPECVADAITERTRAILAVHQMGMPFDMTSLVALANRQGIVVIEDAACAIGSQINVHDEWGLIGRPHGAMACFSFHPRKVITTGEGSMLTTSDPDQDRKLRLWRQHAIDVPDTVRHGSPQVIFENYLFVGFNYRMRTCRRPLGENSSSGFLI